MPWNNGCLVTDANPVILSLCVCIFPWLARLAVLSPAAASALGSLALLPPPPSPQQPCCVTSGESGDIRGFKVCAAAHEQVFVNSQHLRVYLLRIRPSSPLCLLPCDMSKSFWSDACLTAENRPLAALLNNAYASCGVLVSPPAACCCPIHLSANVAAPIMLRRWSAL